LAGALLTVLMAGCGSGETDKSPFAGANPDAPRDAAGRPAPIGLDKITPPPPAR